MGSRLTRQVTQTNAESPCLTALAFLVSERKRKPYLTWFASPRTNVVILLFPLMNVYTPSCPDLFALWSPVCTLRPDPQGGGFRGSQTQQMAADPFLGT